MIINTDTRIIDLVFLAVTLIWKRSGSGHNDTESIYNSQYSSDNFYDLMVVSCAAVL